MLYWKQWFDYKPEFGIIVCKSCEYAVVPAQVERHVRDHHPCITREQRQQFTQSIYELSDVAHTYEQVVYPEPHDEPVTGLPVYYDGLQCHQCRYVCRRIQGIQSHCRKTHGWVNNRKRGGDTTKKSKHRHNRMWDVGVPCQRFFEYRQWQKLFAVKPNVVPLSPSSKHARIAMANRVINDIEAELAAKRAERRIEGSSLRCVANPWLDFVGWHRHLAGFRVKDLIPMTWPARTEKEFDEAVHESQDSIYGETAEADLCRACQATRRMIRAAFAIADIRKVGRAAMEAVNRRELGTDSNERPFYSRLKVQSLRKYTQVWVRVLRYIWRTADTADAPRYKMTEPQQRALRQFRRACQKDEAETQHEAVERQGRAEETSATFWVRMFDHELKDDEFESGIISGLAVLGLDDAGGWRPALGYTQYLSAIVTSMRAIVIQRALSVRHQEIDRAIRDGCSEEDAAAHAPSVVEGVDALVRRFMTLREFGGRISPMDRVFHQRTYGMRIRFTTKAEGRITWQDEHLCIDRVSFTMDDIRSVVHGLEETVRQGIEALLMIESSDEMPALNMDTLFDNPAELTTGWSFLQDARTDWAVDGHRWMWRRMFHDNDVGRRFMKPSREEISSLDNIRWNEAGIEAYFRAVRRWKEELMVLVHLAAGAPARASELISIQHKNGPEAKAQRGIFIENRMMAFVTTYHKGYSASGR